MSILTSLRRAFGFSPETEEEDGEYDPTVPTYAVGKEIPGKPEVAATREENRPPQFNGRHSYVHEAVTTDEKLPADIFDAVIEIFNRTQPEFVRECLNVEAQRQYILNSLSENLRKRVSIAISDNNSRWEHEKELLEKKISELEGDDNEVTRLRKDNHRLQLSVDRQKRALLDRINDLESQVVRYSEEKERLFSRKLKPDSESIVKSDAHVKEIESKYIEQLASLQREKAELCAECEKLREEVKRQTILKEQLEVKTSMSDNMINDLRNQAASARNELERLQHEQETVMVQIQEQLDSFEQLKARKDSKIIELQESNASLRKTIETNLYNQANSEMRLRSEIKELKAELARLGEAVAPVTVPLPTPAPATGPIEESDVAPIPVPSSALPTSPASAGELASMSDEALVKEQRPRRRGRPKKVKSDNDLDSTEWFAGSSKDDPDFGYHEPPHRPANDNEAQLSLF